MDELTHLVALENGKTWTEAQGDVIKAKEGTEQAIAAPSLMMGESLMNTSEGFDTVLYREAVGVFAGIVPFNFPAMIPMGWMTPMCIACGNTIVIKAASWTPQSALKFAELYRQAGLPDGVINIITCSRNEAEILLKHPDVKGITFVGSTSVGLHIYATAAAYGKRVQALCEAKNHALVLNDAPIERTAAGIINSAFGCAGERCMALPVVVVQEDIADRLVAALVRQAKGLKLGAAYDKNTSLGPVVNDRSGIQQSYPLPHGSQTVGAWLLYKLPGESALLRHQFQQLLHLRSLTLPAQSDTGLLWSPAPSSRIFLTSHIGLPLLWQYWWLSQYHWQLRW